MLTKYCWIPHKPLYNANSINVQLIPNFKKNLNGFRVLFMGKYPKFNTEWKPNKPKRNEQRISSCVRLHYETWRRQNSPVCILGMASWHLSIQSTHPKLLIICACLHSAMCHIASLVTSLYLLHLCRRLLPWGEWMFMVGCPEGQALSIGTSTKIVF